jgi:metal-responsive CopG/Arc/MetJ family transcriptional regulator
MHIELDDKIVKKIDKASGPRGRSAFVRKAVEQALEWEERWKLIRSARGAIADYGHEWDDDPAEWVRQQRRADPRRVG